MAVPLSPIVAAASLRVQRVHPRGVDAGTDGGGRRDVVVVRLVHDPQLGVRLGKVLPDVRRELDAQGPSAAGMILLRT